GNNLTGCNPLQADVVSRANDDCSSGPNQGAQQGERMRRVGVRGPRASAQGGLHEARSMFPGGSFARRFPTVIFAPSRNLPQLHAHDTVKAGGAREVLSPADYGAVTIANGISISSHSFAGLTVTSGGGITVNADGTRTRSAWRAADRRRRLGQHRDRVQH